MTKTKRFTFKDGYLFDDGKGNAFLTVGDCCELLNELHEENQEFRKRTKELIAVSLDYPTINLDLMAEAIKSLRELIE